MDKQMYVYVIFKFGFSGGRTPITEPYEIVRGRLLSVFGNRPDFVAVIVSESKLDNPRAYVKT